MHGSSLNAAKSNNLSDFDTCEFSLINSQIKDAMLINTRIPISMSIVISDISIRVYVLVKQRVIVGLKSSSTTRSYVISQRPSSIDSYTTKWSTDD